LRRRVMITHRCGCGVAPAPASSASGGARSREHLRGSCMSCLDAPHEMPPGAVGVTFSCGHWLCLQPHRSSTAAARMVGAMTPPGGVVMHVETSCFAAWARSLLGEVATSEAARASARAALVPEHGDGREGGGDSYTLRCQHCVHGRLPTPSLLALVRTTPSARLCDHRDHYAMNKHYPVCTPLYSGVWTD
jgi:hypothetical protein